MSNPNGSLAVDSLELSSDWSVTGTDRILAFLHNGDVKEVITSNQTYDYFIYGIMHIVLSQQSYYVNSGSSIQLFINATIIWRTNDSFLQLPLPLNLEAKQQTIGSVLISWIENGESYSTSMGKCYLDSSKLNLIIESTIFTLNQSVTIDVFILYHLNNIPVVSDYT